MIKDVNVAQLHLDAVYAALRTVQVELCRWEEVAHPDDKKEVTAAQCVAETAEDMISELRDRLAELAGIIEEVE